MLLSCVTLAMAATSVFAPVPVPVPLPLPHTTVGCGPITGVWSKGSTENGSSVVDVAGFLGIPFAAPPTGRSGRWKPPRKALCWNGTFMADKQPHQCMQFKGHPSMGESEDCLGLNVFTAHSSVSTNSSEPTAGLPVFFWLYGGDNTIGSTTMYGPVQNLVSLYDGRAIVVTANYRLAAFGFLALKELSGEDPRGTSGNYAILDIQLALRWVQENIAAFGGDPKSVTLIGQSSGGTNIFALMASPGSSGLFSAAISLSGSPNMTMNIQTAENQGRSLLDNANCSDDKDPLSCLYNLSAIDIVKYTPTAWDFGGGTMPAAGTGPQTKIAPAGLPIVDGVTVPKPLLDALASGVMPVPMIVSSLAAEMDMEPDPSILNWNVSMFESFIISRFEPWGSTVVDGVSKIYTRIAEAAGNDGTFGYYTLDADIGITCGSLAVARAAAMGGGNTYLVQVAQRPSKPFHLFPETQPATYPFHMWDYIAGFGAWNLAQNIDPLAKPFDPSSDDLAYGKLLRDMWFDIATTGKAGSIWEAVDASSDSLSTTCVVKTSKPSSIKGWKDSTCSKLESWGFKQDYWWVN